MTSKVKALCEEVLRYTNGDNLNPQDKKLIVSEASRQKTKTTAWSVKNETTDDEQELETMNSEEKPTLLGSVKQKRFELDAQNGAMIGEEIFYPPNIKPNLKFLELVSNVLEGKVQIKDLERVLQSTAIEILPEIKNMGQKAVMYGLIKEHFDSIKDKTGDKHEHKREVLRKALDALDGSSTKKELEDMLSSNRYKDYNKRLFGRSTTEDLVKRALLYIDSQLTQQPTYGL
ncbi:hypothetical protein [Legionella gresilensis]|uniref:hypothetical protein n=1 Tax=Legionella gresilensis TaxID=91823 RepID=UPI001041857A|nr:hypothetical protein [Legionella gresilensis]